MQSNDQSSTAIKKMRSNIRTMSLKKLPGSTNSSKGAVDSRLFTGENKLLAVLDPNVNLWSLRYEHGLPPPAFGNKFTTFAALYKFAESYFLRRNIKIEEVID